MKNFIAPNIYQLASAMQEHVRSKFKERMLQEAEKIINELQAGVFVGIQELGRDHGTDVTLTCRLKDEQV